MYECKESGNYIMSFSTTIIREEIERFLSTAYLALRQEYFLFTIAMLISCVVLPVFIVRVMHTYVIKKGRQPKVYLFKVTAKLGLHYAILFLLLGVAVENVYGSIQMVGNTLFQ